MTYLIWSYEHDAWWGPSERGYTKDLKQAGRYNAEDAIDIVYHANAITRELNEIAIPESVVDLFVVREEQLHRSRR